MIRTRCSVFISLSLAVCSIATSAKAQQIAITWDDLPAHGVLPQGETRVEIGHQAHRRHEGR